MLKMKERLLDEIENCRKEERCLQDYRSEMELLMQEKMAHVEELRQIHADINAVRSFTFKMINFKNKLKSSNCNCSYLDGICHQTS